MRLAPALAALGLVALPVSAEAVALNRDAHITASLVAAQAGDVVRKTCPTISARMFVVWTKGEDLKRYARRQGHTEAQVKAFLKDPAEKKRIRSLAERYLQEAGARRGDVESYCRVGREEIARKTLMGSLLRSST